MYLFDTSACYLGMFLLGLTFILDELTGLPSLTGAGSDKLLLFLFWSIGGTT